MYLDITTLDIHSGCLTSEQTIHTTTPIDMTDVLLYGASHYDRLVKRVHNEHKQHVGYVFRLGSNEFWLIAYKRKHDNMYEY